MVTKKRKSPDFLCVYVSLCICIQIYQIEHNYLVREKNNANFLVLAASFHT